MSKINRVKYSSFVKNNKTSQLLTIYKKQNFFKRYEKCQAAKLGLRDLKYLIRGYSAKVWKPERIADNIT